MENPEKHWSGYAPIILSATALMMVAHGYADFRKYGPPTDEGGAEHVFMIVMALQMPIIFYFLFLQRGSLKRAAPMAIAQIFLWAIGLVGGCVCPGFH